VQGALLRRLNAACFAIILASIVAAVGIGVAGIWGRVPTDDGLLWKMLGTCGAVFIGAMTASMAIAWFLANEETTPRS